VTDGEVDDIDVTKCDQILQTAFAQSNFRIAKSVCYVIGANIEPNLSVTCPFTRRSVSKVFSRRGGRPLKTIMDNTPEDLKLIKSLENITLENFEAKYEKIEKLIIAINMGKDGDIKLKNQLVVLKTKLIKELSKTLAKKMNYSEKVRAKLQEQNVQEALDMISNMAMLYCEDDATD
jgi:hypothetical protein